jgi:UDP-glucose 4-epimerase
MPYISIFGTDYNTPDGSCIRDYIHVADIAKAHLLALNSLNAHNSSIYNLGNGTGFSVLEVVQAAKEVTGVDIPTRVLGRRVGDPARLIASSQRINSELDWEPKYTDLRDIITTAWDWHRRYPYGYKE